MNKVESIGNGEGEGSRKLSHCRENPKYSQGVRSGRNLETVQVPYFTDNNKELS